MYILLFFFFFLLFFVFVSAKMANQPVLLNVLLMCLPVCVCVLMVRPFESASPPLYPSLLPLFILFFASVIYPQVQFPLCLPLHSVLLLLMNGSWNYLPAQLGNGKYIRAQDFSATAAAAALSAPSARTLVFRSMFLFNCRSSSRCRCRCRCHCCSIIVAHSTVLFFFFSDCHRRRRRFKEHSNLILKTVFFKLVNRRKVPGWRGGGRGECTETN